MIPPDWTEPEWIPWTAVAAPTDRWLLRFKGRAAKTATIVDGWLRLTWGNAVRLRLERWIHPNDLPAKGSVDLKITLGLAETGNDGIDWVGVVRALPNGSSEIVGRFVCKVEAGHLTGRLRASLPPGETYRLCIQISGAREKLSLGRVTLVAGAADAALPDRPATEPATDPVPEDGRRRALVLAWDVGHNPLGRAYLLADLLRADFAVTLAGPQFDRYGKAVWAPLLGAAIPVQHFPASRLEDFARAALRFADAQRPDLILVSKARMPAILIALLVKRRTGCPVVIDVDDHELGFFAGTEPIDLPAFNAGLERLPDLALPYGGSWTALAETLVPLFDGVTVSNPALAARFGGTVIAHARDERIFRPDAAARQVTRAAFGLAAEDRVILFLGTPRAHKGIVRLAEALDRLADPRLHLVIVGSSNDRALDKRLDSLARARITRIADQPWAKLPEIVRIADGVVLLQDAGSPAAHYQMPAKLTDALAAGIPVAATDLPPLAEFPPEIVTRIASDADLDAFLRAIAEDGLDPARGAQGRAYFERELSYAANRARLMTVVDRASVDAGAWPAPFTKLLDIVSRVSAVPMPPDPAPRLRPQAPAIRWGARFDIALFWKQNDSDIFGRRHDMLVKHLARHPRVGRVVQFDAPVAFDRLDAMARHDADADLDQANFVVANLVRRFLRVADDEVAVRRTFVHARRGERFLGRSLPPREAYADWVKAELAGLGQERPLLGWVAPVVAEYPALHDQLGFDLSVADLIDDQRTMTTPERAKPLAASYAATLRRVDLAFANCASVAESFADMRRDIMVIPNAAEIGAIEPLAPNGRADGGAPVIGCSGNLRERIDVELLARLAEEHPEWRIVLIGSAHGDPPVLRLRKYRNIHFLGVKPYAEAQRHIAAFDVAIMPHLDTAVTRAMNPLKLYVYAAAGVPIVTTRVANIAEIAPFATIADDHAGFIAGIEAALRAKAPPAALPYTLTWPDRVTRILDRIDAYLG